MNSRLFILYTFCFLFSIPIGAQTKNTYTNFIWLNYNNSVQINNKWKILNDVQYRTRNWFQYQSVFALRSGLSYSINKHTNIAVGFAWFANYKYINENPIIANEYRPWQDISFQSVFNNKKILSNRIRIEERFLQQIKNGGQTNFYDQRLRLRYRLEFGMPIAKSKITCNIGNEVMVNIDYLFSNRFFDQNRAYIFLNVPIFKNTLFQFQYLKILQWQVDNNTQDDQNVFRCSIHQQLNAK
jgi:Protein of unknown function (DUF2490)